MSENQIDQNENNQNEQQKQENNDPQERIDLWQIACQTENKNNESKNKQKTVIVIGDTSAGKTQTLEYLRDNSRSEEIKPTSGIDFSYIKKSYNSTEVLSIYEIAGGRTLKHMINNFITQQKFVNHTVVLTVDLSKPLKLIDSMTFWFDSIRSEVTKFLEGKPDFAQDYKFSQMEKVQNHPDRTRIDPLPINTILICTKYDIYEKFDSEKRKWISRTIRFLAHLNGASVLYSGSNTAVQNQFRGAFNTLLFQNSNQEEQEKFCQTEHIKPIFISFPEDQVAKIGLPPGQGAGIKQNLDEFQKILSREFQEEDEAKKKDIFVHYSKFSEQKIDTLKIEKDNEMKRMQEKLKAQLI